MPNDKDTLEAVVSHIREKFGYAQEFGNKRFDLSVEELGYLLKQNEQQQVEISQKTIAFEGAMREIQGLREQLRDSIYRHTHEEILSGITDQFQQSQEEAERLRGELDTAKLERDDYRKVLEWYADIDAYTVIHLGCSPMVMSDRGKLACDILSRYPEKGE